MPHIFDFCVQQKDQITSQDCIKILPSGEICCSDIKMKIKYMNGP